MNKLTAFALTTLLASSALVYAGNDHNHANKNTMAGNEMNMPGMANMGMSGMMQGKMQKMKADLMAMQNENDPAKRKALMKTHMQDMKGMMEMMKSQRGKMQGMNMDTMEKLETRVAMLEAMLEQIVDTHITSLNPDDPVYQMD
jgi:hypothetical protein